MMKNFGQKKLLGLLCVLLFAIGTNGCGNEKVQYVDLDTTSKATEQETSSQSAEPIYVYVYVCGAVNVPGVYAMEEGSRVCDLFDTAGGLTTDAAGDYWNQARPLTDGEMIYVPTQEEADERTAEEWAMAGSISPCRGRFPQYGR